MKNLILLKLVIFTLFIAEPSQSQKLSDYDFIDYFEDGIAPAKKDQNWGFVNEKGKTIVAPKYDFVFRFKEGFAPVVRNNKWGFVNKKGKEVIPLEYDFVDSFSEGLARVYQNGGFTFINPNQKVIIDDQLVFASQFINGVAIAAKKIQTQYEDVVLFGLINTKGEILADYEYNQLELVGDGLYAYDSYIHENDYDYMESHLGYIGVFENSIIETPYNQETDNHPFLEMQPVEKVELNKKKQNPLEAKKLLQKLNIPFDEVMPVYEQSAVFIKNNLAGLVNLHNENIVPTKFDEAADLLIDGLLEVKLNEEYFFIDKTGQKVNINLKHFIKMNDDFLYQYQVESNYNFQKRTDFGNIKKQASNLVAPAPPLPPSPSVIEVVEDEAEIEEDILIEPDGSFDVIEVEPDYEEEKTNIPFALVEEAPIYPGCEESTSNDEIKICTVNKINKFINENFNTSILKELNLSGVNRIFVMFEINKEGHIDNIKTRSSHAELASEAERIMKLLPQLKPGKQNNKAVNVSYTLPVTLQTP